LNLKLTNPLSAVQRQKKKAKSARKAGTLKGMIHISDDFHEPLEDFKEYME